MRASGKQVVFLGYSNSFSYYNIGGTDSVVRRIADKLIEDGYRVVFLQYGCEVDSESEPVDGISVICCKDFTSALSVVIKCSDVITIYLKKSDRLKYLFFRKKNIDIRFHQFVFTWPESRLKRFAMLADIILFKLNGKCFCVSPRLKLLAQKLGIQAELLLPPVPKDYFLKPVDKKVSQKVKVAFLGRIDAGKGVMSAFQLLQRLSERKDCECFISGFPWLFKPETVMLHNRLLEQENIKYIPVQYDKWTPEVCRSLRDMLKDIDILLLPYKHLSSTIDMPLLLLEAMASLCVVVAPDLGSMYEVYGNSPFGIGGMWDEDMAFGRIIDNICDIPQERERLFNRASEIVFDIDGVYEKFRQCLAN